MIYCKECLEKQRKNNELEEEIASLKGKLRWNYERTVKITVVINNSGTFFNLLASWCIASIRLL